MGSPLENYTPEKHLAALSCGGRKSDKVGFDLEQRVGHDRLDEYKRAMDAASRLAAEKSRMPTARHIIDYLLASGWEVRLHQHSPNVRRVVFLERDRNLQVGFYLNDGKRPMCQFIRTLRRLHLEGAFEREA
jgi:hypothetical protein